MTTLTDEELLAWLEKKGNDNYPNDSEVQWWCDLIAARFRELLAQQEWQSTGPTDGTKVVGINPQKKQEALMCFVNGEWECVDYDGMLRGIGFYPTLFYPLPAPPKDG